MNFLDFFINDLRPVILDHLGARKWEDARGDFYLEPAKTEEVGGFPMYNDLLVIVRPGDSIWAPVPVERFARTLTAEMKNGAADAEKTRNRAKTDLEAFLFKRELPRSAIQLITVENIKWCREEVASRKEKTVGDCTANLEVVRQLDWQRVAALLEK